jgi:uncharacterized cupin superfamily protein
MPKIDIDSLKIESSTGYPEPFRKVVEGRSRKRLGNAAGLTQFGVNLTTLKPGAASALRHWHTGEDEFVYMLAGEVVLCEDGGEVVLRPGDAAGFKAGVANGHRLVNRSDRDAVYLEVGARAARENIPTSTCALSGMKRAGVISTNPASRIRSRAIIRRHR